MTTFPQSQKLTLNYKNLQLSVSIKQRVSGEHLILFLHGLGCAKESFDYVFGVEELQDYSLCTLDFVGFGDSDKRDNFSYALEDQAAIAKLVVEQLAPKRISIVAHSMGGAIGVLLAEQLPNLQKFIDVEGNLLAGDCGLVSRTTAMRPLEDFVQTGYQEFLEMLRTSDRADFHEWAIWYQQASPKAIHASSKSMVEWSDSEKLLGIYNSLPDTTYIYGDEEPKEYLLPRFTQTNISYLPRLHHFMMIENPRRFFQIIAEILRNE